MTYRFYVSFGKGQIHPIDTFKNQMKIFDEDILCLIEIPSVDRTNSPISSWQALGEARDIAFRYFKGFWKEFQTEAIVKRLFNIDKENITNDDIWLFYPKGIIKLEWE